MAGWIVFCAIVGLLLGGWMAAGKGIGFASIVPVLAVALIIWLGLMFGAL